MLGPTWSMLYKSKRELLADIPYITLPTDDYVGWIVAHDRTFHVRYHEQQYIVYCWDRPNLVELLQSYVAEPMSRQ